MKTFKLIFLLIFCLAVQISYSQQTGGGELNPGIYTNPESIAKFQDMRFGLSIHWGPNVAAGKEISWSRGKQTPKDEYDGLYKQFNPEKFDADEWVKLTKEFGMKYLIITSKHHDGFSMWHSDYSDYDIENTPFKRDILMELSTACRKGESFLAPIIRASIGTTPIICPMARAALASCSPLLTTRPTKTAIGFTRKTSFVNWSQNIIQKSFSLMATGTQPGHMKLAAISIYTSEN
ncbi:hypothetical protein MASR2M47_29730 [Draconibacterium sp.]